MTRMLLYIGTLCIGTLWLLLQFPSTTIQSSQPIANPTLVESIPNITQITHSGGLPTAGGLCPTSPLDVIVPLDSLRPSSKPGEPTMTIDGINTFIKTHSITTIEGLIHRFPVHYRTNFSLMEHTRATGEASLRYPRIILFGSDGRFLLNVGTKPDDPKFNLLDVAELRNDGTWRFASFDFSESLPVLQSDATSCMECHGKSHLRPFWGTNLDWPGAFGDNIAAGPQGEALDHRHVQRIHELMDGIDTTDRFTFLMWDPRRLRRGQFRRIAHHVLGAELLLSNIAIGTAVGHGVFVRMASSHPERYRALRTGLLLLGYEQAGDFQLTPEEQDALRLQLAPFEVTDLTLDALLAAVGIHTDTDFSLGTLAGSEDPDPTWKLGRGDLYELVLLQVLYDLSVDDPHIAHHLKTSAPGPGIFGCPKLASNMLDVVNYKMLHLFWLRGSARYEVNRVYYAADGEDIYARVFHPTRNTVGTYLRHSLIGQPQKVGQASDSDLHWH